MAPHRSNALPTSNPRVETTCSCRRNSRTPQTPAVDDPAFSVWAITARFHPSACRSTESGIIHNCPHIRQACLRADARPGLTSAYQRNTHRPIHLGSKSLHTGRKSPEVANRICAQDSGQLRDSTRSPPSSPRDCWFCKKRSIIARRRRGYAKDKVVNSQIGNPTLFTTVSAVDPPGLSPSLTHSARHFFSSTTPTM